MPSFSYSALKNGKETVTGKIDADSVKDVREFLRKLNLIPTKIEVQEATNIEEKAKTKLVSKVKLRALKIREKVDFTNTLYILSKTGISLVEALFFIELNSPSKNVKLLASEIRKYVLAGSTLSDAVDKLPHIFDMVYSGLIRTGEESGELDITLSRMAILLEKQEIIASEVKAAMMYPGIVCFIATGVTLLMLTFVFPKFKEMYGNMGAKMPMITSVLMDTGEFLANNWWVIPIFLLQ